MTKEEIDCEDPENEDLTAAGANVIVAFNSSANLYLKQVNRRINYGNITQSTS